MRSLEKNKIKMKFSVLESTESVTTTETYTDKFGVVHNIGTGTKKAEYSEPKEFRAKLQERTGYVQDREYGIDLSDYSASIITTIDIGIDETSLIWVHNEVKYKIENEQQIVDETSADYKVIKITKNLNQIKYILKRNNDNDETRNNIND